ncbi:MAG: hypothetical protein U0L35_01415, partial [Methanobrevibacter sp.]|nr:hypothetical protein [Methanobrevibacter sp.]
YNAILVILFFFNIQGPIKTSMIKANITLTSVIEYMMGTTISKKGFCNPLLIKYNNSICIFPIFIPP